MSNTFTIGQLAESVGMSAKTIRYYENIKLLQPAKRMENKYRTYSGEDIKRIIFIKQARALGLPLHEVKQLVDESFEGTCEHLKANLIRQLPEYISSVKKRIEDLQKLQHQLEDLQKSFDELPLKNPKKRVKDKRHCEVLEHLEKSIVKGGE